MLGIKNSEIEILVYGHKRTQTSIIVPELGRRGISHITIRKGGLFADEKREQKQGNQILVVYEFRDFITNVFPYLRKI